MAKTVKLPGIGKVRQEYAVIAGATVAGVVGFLYWRQRTTPADIPLGPVDPGAGLIENDPQYQSSGEPGLYGPDGSGGFGEPRPGNFITNAEWFQYAVNYLDGQLGIDRGVAGAALAKFLDRERLNPTEISYVQQAIAAAGQPPQNGPFQILPETGGGNPPSQPPSQQPPSGGGAARVSGLRVEGSNSQDITWRWNPVPGAAWYDVKLIQGTRTVIHQTQVTVPRWRVRSTYPRPLAPSRPYRIEVRTVMPNGSVSSPSSNTGRTKAR